MANKLKLETYFDDTTMSVHLREGVLPKAKKGQPGNWSFESKGRKKLSAEDIQAIANEITEATQFQDDGFIELEREGSTVVQLGMYRIVITRPPFSDGWEITAVRPVTQRELAEYELSEKLHKRICEQAEGILVAGSPGMGKSTFAAALIKNYAKQDKIVKTIEAPRDLVLPEEITQYAISHGSAEEIKDVLLLSRPDYTLFDEMRNTDDFMTYADLRLAGIGLAGVIHGATPMDAIQRFVGRLELGVIPHVVDTVIFIKNGEVDAVLSLKMEVKVPAGMTEADLARPVVVIREFESNKPAFELYSYGEETVLIPVEETAKMEKGVNKFAKEALLDYFDQFSRDVEVEIVSGHKAIVRVPESIIPKLIGKQGKRISAIEDELGMSIDVQELKGKGTPQKSEGLRFSLTTDKNHIVFHLNNQLKNKDVQIFIEGERILNAKTSKRAAVKVHKKSPEGKLINHAMKEGNQLVIVKV